MGADSPATTRRRNRSPHRSTCRFMWRSFIRNTCCTNVASTHTVPALYREWWSLHCRNPAVHNMTREIIGDMERRTVSGLISSAIGRAIQASCNLYSHLLLFQILKWDMTEFFFHPFLLYPYTGVNVFLLFF
jgi:hypothetical protein